MRIKSSPATQFAEILKLNGASSRLIPQSIQSSSIAKATSTDRQTVFPLACWNKNGFQVIARFDLKKGALIDIYQKGKRLKLKGHLKLEQPILQKTEAETLNVLSKAQKFLASTWIELNVSGKEVHITPRVRAEGGTPLATDLQVEPKASNTISSTRVMASLLRGNDSDSIEIEYLGLQCIKAFEGSAKRPQDIAEIAELCGSGSAKLTRAALASLLKPLKENTLLDPSLLFGLARALDLADSKSLEASDLVSILQYLNDRIDSVASTDSKRLVNELGALSALLDAMVAADVKGLSREQVQKGLMQKLGSFSSSSNSEVAYLAKSCEQALIRIPSDESKVHRVLRRALHAGEGVSLLAQAWGQKSIGTALGAFKEFHKAFKPDKGKSNWYDAYQFAKLLISQGHYKEAAKVLSQVSKDQQLQVTTLLSHVIAALPAQEQALAKRILSDLPTCQVSGLGKPGTSLINSVRTNLTSRLSELKFLRSTPSEEEKLYVPLDGRTDPSSSERLNLLQEAQEFIASDKQVLLIQGGSGAGKSMFLRMLERACWKQDNASKGPIPIHIRLGGIDPRSPTIIEDALKGMNFTAEQIADLKRSRSFVFLLDGYDEMAKGQLVNLLEHGGIKEWKSKVVIGCRSQHLANVANWQRYFAPSKGDTLDVEKLRTLHVVPFSDEQIRSYLDKYLEGNSVSGWNTDRFISVISQIKGLKDLIESPFILRMTAEVLPNIVSDDTKLQDMTLTRRNLYDAFATHWFKRQEAKLRAAGQEIPSGLADFEAECLQYCQDLAMAMVKEHVVEASYNPMSLFSEGGESSPFEEFFGSDLESSILRKSAPLTETSSGYAFIHKTMLEHFASKATAAELAALGGAAASKGKGLAARRATLQAPALEKALLDRDTTYDIESTSDLAKALQSGSLKGEERATLHQLALDTVKAFRSQPLTAELIEELVPLASIPDEGIVRRVLEELILPIDQDVMVDLRLVEGLRKAVALTDTQSIDSSNLVTCLDVLEKRLASSHKTGADESLIKELHALDALVCALLDSGMKGDATRVKSLIETLGDATSKNLQVTAARKSLKEALLRLDTDEDRISTWLERGKFISEGISSLVEGAGSYSPKKIVEGLIAFKGAVKTKGNKHIWYDEVRAAKLLVQVGDIESYRSLGLELKEPHAQLALIEALSHGVINTSDEEVRAAWIDEVIKIASKGDKDVQSSTRGLLESLQAFDAPEVREVLGAGLNQIKAPASSWLALSSPVVIPSESLINSGKSSSTWCLAKLKAEALNDPSVLEESSFHVPLNASHSVTASTESHFSLDQGVKSFFSDDSKRVMLLLGDSGSGKSLSMKLLAAELWKSYKAEDPIPLFISLTGHERSSKTIVEDALKKVGLRQEQISQLKQNHSFIFILDGYDEMSGSEVLNPFATNSLLSWKGKTILTCRTQYAQQIAGGYPKVFTPVDAEGNTHAELFKEITTVPFSSSQIKQYLSQFCKQTNVAWSPDLYLQYVDKIPHLQEMIETPFALRILTEVLPSIVEKHGANNVESLKLTRVDFYEAFVRHWFERQLDKLIRGGWGDLSRNEIEGYYAYAVQLATQMHGSNLNEISYTPPRRGKADQHPFAKFFASEPPMLVRARTACPLVVSREGKALTYRFMHKSILEYLGGRDMFSQAVVDADGLAEIVSEAAIQGPKVEADNEEFGFQDNQPAAAAAAASSQGDFTLNTLDSGSVASSALNARLFSEDMGTLRFWVDDVNQIPGFKEKLLSMVELSKRHPEVAFAAANAMTILVGAGHSFAKADLRGIHIPGARLDRGNFSQANLEGADLKGCSLQEAFLSGVNCNGANLENTAWGQLAPFVGPESGVFNIEYNKDGTRLASASALIGDARVWDAVLGGEGRRITKVDDASKDPTVVSFMPIYGLAFRKDGARLALGRMDNTIQIWDTSQKVGQSKLLYAIPVSSALEALRYSPDGKHLAVALKKDKSAYVYGAEEGGQPELFLEGHSAPVVSIVYSADGNRIATGSIDKTIKVWDAHKQGQALLTIEGHTDHICSVAFNPDGTRIVSTSKDQTAKVWDARLGGQALLNLKGHTKSLRSADYSRDGGRIATASEDGTVRIWDAYKEGAPQKVLLGHRLGAVSVVFSPDGSHLASSGIAGVVRIWESLDKAYLTAGCKGHDGKVQAVAHSPDGIHFASGGSDCSVRIWNAKKVDDSVHQLLGHMDEVTAIAYNGDGSRLASGSYDKTVRVWDAIIGGAELHTLRGHLGGVCAVSFSKDGTRIVSGGEGEGATNHGLIVRVWDAINGGRALQTIEDSPELLDPRDIGPSNRFLINSIPDIDDLGHPSWLSDYKPRVTSVAYSPDGRRVASSIEGTNSVRMWDTSNLERVATLKGHSRWVKALAFDKDGGRLVSGSRDETVRLWDVMKRKSLMILRGHTDSVTSVCFKGDGNFVASGSEDKTIRIWDVAQKGLACMTIHEQGSVLSIAFSRDGSFLASGCDDGGLRLWKVSENAKSSHLIWRSNRQLEASKIRIEGARMGLTTSRLLKYNKAIGYPIVVGSGSGQVDNRNRGAASKGSCCAIL